MTKRSLPSRLFRCVLFTAIGCVFATVACVVLLRWLDPPTSAFMLRERWMNADQPQQTVLFRWSDWDQIAAPMKVAVIAAEDQTFPSHYGFDLESIDKAFTERARGRVRGASTITQQVAKNLFLWPGRSWIRKGLEAYFTLLIELAWPKARILEVYLNIAEFGPGVYGVGAASEKFFRKPAARLNNYDAALLAAVLPNPKRFRAHAPSAYVRSRQQWIMQQMRGLGGTAVLKQLDLSPGRTTE